MSFRLKNATLFAWDGQSLMLFPNTANAIPAKCMANLSGYSQVVAISGSAYVQREEDATRRVDSLVASASGPRILTDLGCHFELSFGLSAASILATCESYWQDRQAAGFQVVALTIPDSTVFDPDADDERADLNAAILSSSVPDAVADIAARPSMSDASDNTYFIDGTHLRAAGVTDIEPTITAAIQTLL